MNEPTFYRISGVEQGYPDALNDLIADGWLVPVERCEHGNIDGHYPIHFGQGHNERTTVGPWCPGAGIGGDE